MASVSARYSNVNMVLYAICSSPFFVRIVGDLAELLQLSILVLVSTIYAVLSKNLGAVMKFMLEPVALLRRIYLCVWRRRSSPTS